MISHKSLNSVSPEPILYYFDIPTGEKQIDIHTCTCSNYASILVTTYCFLFCQNTISQNSNSKIITSACITAHKYLYPTVEVFVWEGALSSVEILE